jgi:ribosomal protein S18 acetylase RimI-like enzyme
MAISIEPARTAEDYRSFAALIEEYVGWCRTRFADDPWYVDTVFGHQALDEELAGLAKAYGPPKGRSFIARVDGQVRGAGAYRRLSEGICEMKRLYVPPQFQGLGLGRLLASALMEAAGRQGYRLMRLDSGKRHHEAIGLYEALGFKFCLPYHDYPPELMPHMVFMERELTSGELEPHGGAAR